MALHSPELERSVLASLMIWPDNFNERWARFPSEVFFLESHRRFYKLMGDLWDEYGGFDFVTIVQRLRDEERFEDISVFSAIAKATDDVTSAFGDVYTAELLRLYQRRVASEVYREAASSSASGEDLSTVNAKVEAILAALSYHDVEDERDDLEAAVLSIY